jgi:hypothetical protein
MRFETNKQSVRAVTPQPPGVFTWFATGEDTMIATASSSEPVSLVPRHSLQVALSPDDRRFQRLGENHHLWRNGRFWWIAYTVIIDGWRQERIRHSLKTDDLTEARVRRDDILATVSSEGVLRRVS